ncbi:hypothetical protein MBAV_003445 [Candidatus Magnetobacterium bavaricum]|uniref:Uncharacterized protein n=1 Tax=Candidatus Magnetobacterium bavaricum TaxID=29290 RepID=A0A0F3GR11_9BACT|nr:hypothetical protein MBAV_003445 [Candidatus Magnetobacterium bavaricum]
MTVSYHKSGETFAPQILKSMIEIQAEWTSDVLSSPYRSGTSSFYLQATTTLSVFVDIF